LPSRRLAVSVEGGPGIVWQSTSLALKLFWRRLPLMILANAVWLLLSLLVVTWPAATAGLFYLAAGVVREELDDASQETRFAAFWAGFRAHGVRSTLLTSIVVLGLGVIVMALLFYGRSPVEPLRWLVGPIGLVGLVWVAAQLYVYPLLLKRPDLGPLGVLREAMLIAVAYPLVTIPLLLTSLILAVAAAILLGPVLLVFFSAMAMLQTVTLRLLLVERGEIAVDATS
jgi:uncharacterized membrane protein YesL